MSVELVGRDAELAQVESFTERAATNGAALAIVGSAGIGKTALWRAGVATAHARGLRVLETRCVEVEMPIPLGHLADLVGGVLDEVADELPVPQRAALAVGLGLEAPERGFTPDWLALARATLSVLTVLARRSPVLVAVDDAQWLDPASSRVLTYALRRTAGIPVGVLTTVRTDAGTADPLALADAGSLEALPVGPLSIGGLQHLVRTRLGAYLPRATLARIHEASGGNPMFALEFARLVDDGPRAPTPLAVPRTLEDVVAARLERLPPEVLPVLEAASAVERPTVALLAAVLEEDDVEALVELAVACDALVDTRGNLAFAHPLVKAAAYFRIAPARRRALHRALAAAAPTLEERGRHAALATAEPDSAVAALVGEAADAAAARGALHAAAELAAEAARIEPDPGRSAERLIDAAAHLVDVGEFAAARELLEPLLAAGAPSGRALLVRAESEIANRPLLIEFLEDALAVADDVVRWQALTRLAQHGRWVSGDGRGAVSVAREAAALAMKLDEQELVVASDAAVAFYESACGLRTDDADDETAPPVVRLREPWWSVGPGLSLGSRLMWAGRYDAARAAFAAERNALAAAGREARVGYLLVHWADLEWRAGRWSDADALADEATDLLGDLVVTASPRALLLATRGDEDAARSLAGDMLEWCEWLHDGYHRVRAHWFLTLLELSLGDPAAAAPHAEAALAALDEGGIENPGYLPVLPDVIECHLAAGELADATDASLRLRRLADTVATPYADALAQRGAALVAHASGDTGAAVDHARRAIAGFASPFDAARSELLLGDAHRRAGERRLAAEAIGRAAERFGELGARLWLQRAETELRRASPRARDRHELTAAEERVAALVAAGRANKEVAAELFTTVATVEAHLTRIYRKLGVRSRSELARGVADGSITFAEK